MMCRMLSIATSSSKRATARRRRQPDSAESQAPETLDEGKEQGRHLKSVDAEDPETEPSDAESEVEVGASAAGPDVAGLPIDAGPDHDAGAAPASAAAGGLESTPTDYSTI